MEHNSSEDEVVEILLVLGSQDVPVDLATDIPGRFTGDESAGVVFA